MLQRGGAGHGEPGSCGGVTFGQRATGSIERARLAIDSQIDRQILQGVGVIRYQPSTGSKATDLAQAMAMINVYDELCKGVTQLISTVGQCKKKITAGTTQGPSKIIPFNQEV